MNLLAVDIGNSNIVLGFYKDAKCLQTWRIKTSLEAPINKYEMDIRSYLLEQDINLDSIQKVVLSSVVPSLSEGFVHILESIFSQEVLVLTSKLYPKLPISTLNPDEIGTDLVANALAAFKLYKHSCVVVDFGTALTFTSISDKGEILGVAIAPGLKTALHSLFSNTAKLPNVPLEVPKSALGKDTVHAIQAGVLLGYVGLVRELVHQTGKEMPENCKFVATGGLSSILTSLQGSFDKIIPNLTLDGLRWLTEYC